jgi:hypothetical protein
LDTFDVCHKHWVGASRKSSDRLCVAPDGLMTNWFNFESVTWSLDGYSGG